MIGWRGGGELDRRTWCKALVTTSEATLRTGCLLRPCDGLDEVLGSVDNPVVAYIWLAVGGPLSVLLALFVLESTVTRKYNDCVCPMQSVSFTKLWYM